MTSSHSKIYLFVHIIWKTAGRDHLLSRPVRVVLFAHLQKYAAEKGIKMLSVNGVEDHVHCLIQLHPAQNLSQVARQLRDESSRWINESRIMQGVFEWDNDYAAYSVSPSG